MALNALKKFANNCGIPNKGGVKSGYGHLALANTPQLKFESKYYVQVREALKNTLEKDPNFFVFFRGIGLKESIKGLPPKGKYFTLCLEKRNPQRCSQLIIANNSSMGI
jgi:hypothetical protein